MTLYKEVNTRCNLPAQIDIEATEGEEYRFLCVVKGGGSANKSYLFQKTKAILNPKALIPFLYEQIKGLGTAACPPYHIAVVIGGTSAEKTMLTVKLASTKFYDNLPTTGDETGRAFRDVELENKLLELANNIGLGAQFGGKYLAHDVRVIRLPRHGASCPIGIGVSCSADRNVKCKINREGLWVEKLDDNPAELIPEEFRHMEEGETVKIDLNQPMEKIRAELSKHPVSTRVSLTGKIIVARDIAHAKLQERLDKGEPLPQEPFAFTDQPTQPTSFEAIYFYGGIKYAYGFSFDKSRILTEYLYHWPNGREALIFSRENNGYQFRENIQEQFTLAGRTAENRLYLSSSNEWNCPQTEKAYLWFFEKLTGFMGTEMRLDAALSAIRLGGSEKSRILHEMLYADLGIKDIRITGSKEEPIISALHTLDNEDGTSKGFWLPLGQESVGTQRFFSRIGMWLAALESGAVLVVDEIESSMHPLLTRHLIEMMQDAAINTNHTQLIFTTHDTGLLDLTLLRRDQIWFAEKDEKTMQTDIYALTEFSPRKGENISKGYLQGRYGAIPFIGGSAAWAE